MRLGAAAMSAPPPEVGETSGAGVVSPDPTAEVGDKVRREVAVASVGLLATAPPGAAAVPPPGNVIDRGVAAEGAIAVMPLVENPSRLVRWATNENRTRDPAVSAASATPTKGVHAPF